MNIHQLSANIAIEDSNSSGGGLDAQSRTAGTHDTAGIDSSQLQGPVQAFISAGSFGGSATLDAKVQESSDNSTFTDNPNIAAITTLTAEGNAKLEFRIRQLTKQYFRVRTTVGTAAVVYSVTLAYIKLLPNG